MALLLLGLPGNEAMTHGLAEALGCDVGMLEVRRFPDRETYVRLRSEVAGREVALVCTLDDPDPKLAQILFAADLVREMGATGVGLVAPYLAYMRQDRRFDSGEAITSRSCARLLSGAFDWLATVAPHLHRYSSLGEIYSIPTMVAPAAPVLADWIRSHVSEPLIVGPDSESDQWVTEVAQRAKAPHVTFSKRRLGDREVRIEAPDLAGFRGRQPVLIDDIVSSGRTLVEAANQLTRANLSKPYCLIVHALFAEGAVEALGTVGADIISSDTIAHPTNRLGVAKQLAAAIGELTNASRTVPLMPAFQGEDR